MKLRDRLYRAIARLDVGHPWLVLAIAGALAAGSIWYTKARLEFQTGQEDLVRDSSRDTRNYHAYEREFPDLDGLIVIVRAKPDYARAEKFADTLAARLASDPASVKSVFYKIDPAAFSGTALLYLSRDEIAGLGRNLRDHQELLASYAAAPTLQNLFGLVNREADHAMVSHLMSGLFGAGGGAASPADGGAPDLAFVDAVLDGMLSAKGDRADLPWDRLTSPRADEGVLRDGYLATENGKYLLMNVAQGDGVDGGPDPVDVIQERLDTVRAAFPDVEAGMTGGPALARAEEHSSARDIALASLIAIASNVLLIVIPFGGIIEPGFAIAALLAGVAWSFGFTTLAVGHLNLLSAIFTSVLAGIGINFPIHLMARYDEARRAGRTMPDAVELAVVNTGAGVVASATIMALAFLMPVFSGFRGIAELGLVSAGGLFCCLVAAMTVFPALLAIRDRDRAAVPIADAARDTRLDRLFARPRVVVGAALAATAFAPLFMRNLSFDQNLLKLQAESAEAVRFEDRLLHDSGRSTWFAVALAADRADAERKAAAFRRLPEVAEAQTIATYIPSAQAEKRAMLAALKPELDAIRPAALAAPSDPAALQRELESLRFKLGSAHDDSIEGTRAMVADAIDRLKDDPRAFDSYERRMAGGLGVKLAEFRRALDPGTVTEATLPAVLRDRFIGHTGKYLVQIYPRGDVWDDAPLSRFVGALKSVNPDVTGPPVQTWAIARVMRRGYERAGALALLAVFVFVLADFRSLRDTALATVPLVFGGAWLLATMGMLKWEFNLANLFAVPIIIGTGVDNGVNMLYRWREERRKSRLILDVAVGKSVTIASLTTIAGFAALIPAAHRGISSLGWVLSVGIAFILIATLAVLPAMLELIGRRIERAGAQHGGGVPRGARVKLAASRRSTGLYLIAFAIALPALLAISGGRASAADQTAARAESDKLVADAEALVAEAGKRNPVDSSLIRKAIDKLNEAVKVDPRNDSAFVDLGFCYSVLREADTAVQMYMRATQINPSGTNFKELADIYLRVGDPDDALMAADAGIVKDPRNAKLYNAKGMALHDLERFDEAADAFQKALDLDPSLAVARANLDALNGGSTGRGTVAKHRKHAASQ
jgi:uncharacterized protein